MYDPAMLDVIEYVGVILVSVTDTVVAATMLPVADPVLILIEMVSAPSVTMSQSRVLVNVAVPPVMVTVP